MAYESLLRLDARLSAILNEARKKNDLHSILLTDASGLAISHAGKIEGTGIAAIAPELLRVGEKARSLGCYDSMSCVIVMLDNSHLMIIKTMSINGQQFVVVMDAPLAPKGLPSMLTNLKEDIAKAMKTDKSKEEEA